MPVKFQLRQLNFCLFWSRSSNSLVMDMGKTQGTATGCYRSWKSFRPEQFHGNPSKNVWTENYGAPVHFYAVPTSELSYKDMCI